MNITASITVDFCYNDIYAGVIVLYSFTFIWEIRLISVYHFLNGFIVNLTVSIAVVSCYNTTIHGRGCSYSSERGQDVA